MRLQKWSSCPLKGKGESSEVINMPSWDFNEFLTKNEHVISFWIITRRKVDLSIRFIFTALNFLSMLWYIYFKQIYKHIFQTKSECCSSVMTICSSKSSFSPCNSLYWNKYREMLSFLSLTTWCFKNTHNTRNFGNYGAHLLINGPKLWNSFKKSSRRPIFWKSDELWSFWFIVSLLSTFE